MSGRTTRLLGSLESGVGTVFLVAGSLMLVTTAINAIDVFTPIATQDGVLLTIEAGSGFGGVVLFFVGLLGLYPRLAAAAPRLARVGALLATVPAVFFFVLLVVCLALAPLLGFPSLKVVVPSFGLIAEVILLSFALALTLLGSAAVRTAVPARAIGGFLLVIALAWFGFFGAMLAARYDIPTWVTLLQTALMALPMVAIGVRLRMAVEQTGRESPTPEPTV